MLSTTISEPVIPYRISHIDTTGDLMNYTVDFTELRDTAERYGELHVYSRELVRQLNGVELTQPDFGRIPWLQTRVWEAFSQHTTDCLDALTELTEALQETDQGLGSTADAYEQWEDDAAEAIASFFAGVLES